jgi:hypothetical protein
LRFTGPQIAETLGMALSTVSGILTRIGMGKLGRIGLEPPERYERERPGELIHIDVKKLGRILVPGHAVTGNRRQGGAPHDLHRRRPAGRRRRLGVRPHRDRRLHAARLRRGAPRRARNDRDRVP